jgi:hypothetical protein
MKLFNRNEITGRSYVVQSSATKCNTGKIALSVGVRLQEKGRLYRTNVLKFDGTSITQLTESMTAHYKEVTELVNAMSEVRDWCEERRATYVAPSETVTFTKVVEQEWPTMFYAVQSNTRIDLYIYGRDLDNASIGFRKDRADSYQNWKAEMDGIIDNFWTHLEEVEGLKMQDLLTVAV